MSGQEAEPRILFSVVLSDANIVFSRVLRDYVLYAMTHQLIRVRWSQVILDEAVRRLIEKVDGFDEASGERLVTAMNGTFPYSQVELTEEAKAAVADFALIDENDRHVIAAAVAAEATFVCSDDLTGFPPEVMAALGIEWVTADALLSTLIEEAPKRCSRFIGRRCLDCPARPTSRRLPRFEVPRPSGQPTSWKAYSRSSDHNSR